VVEGGTILRLLDKKAVQTRDGPCEFEVPTSLSEPLLKCKDPTGPLVRVLALSVTVGGQGTSS
jgi:hypothetical protein